MKNILVACLGGMLLLAGRAGAADADKGNVDVADLVKKLKSDNASVRVKAETSLLQIGPDAAAGVPALIGALKDDDNSVAAVASLALARIGAPAVAPLTDALKDGKPGVRALAAATLKRIGPDAKPAVAALVALVKSPGPEAAPAIDALGAIGPAAKEAVPELVKVLQTKSRPAGPQPPRVNAAVALGQIGGKEAVAALTEALKDKDRGGIVAVHAAEALGKIGPAAKEAVAALQEATAGDTPLSVAARQALGEIQKK
jgi:HEAT repeat protein